jgi:hypothetical protein
MYFMQSCHIKMSWQHYNKYLGNDSGCKGNNIRKLDKKQHTLSKLGHILSTTATRHTKQRSDMERGKLTVTGYRRTKRELGIGKKMCN